MKTIKDLVFEDRHDGVGGTASKMFFPNGYGVSVIEGGASYTTGGTYELAVLKGKEGYWGLTYDTPITDDVLGHQSPDQITSLMRSVQELLP